MTWIQDYILEKSRLSQEQAHAMNRLTDHRNKGALSLSKTRVDIEDEKLRITPSGTGSVAPDGSVAISTEDAIKLARWIINGPEK